MARRLASEEQIDQDDAMSVTEDRRARRLGSSILNLLPRQLSRPADRQSLHTAFIQSAAILFVLVCGACALLAYRVLEPFLRSILWSILAGAFLFPFKKHFTSRARAYLEELDQDSHLLFYGLVVLLPLRTFNRTIESITSIELLQTGVIYHWITGIVCNSFAKFIFIVHLLDSPWVTAVVIGYLIAVLSIYEHSPLVTNLLNFFAIPVWFILLIYLSQFLPAAYRLTVVCLAIVLTVVGLVFDLRERISQYRAESDSEQRRTSIVTDLVQFFTHLIGKNKAKREETSSVPSASSTPYFTIVFWSLLAIKVHQFFWYLLLIPCLVEIYKKAKDALINTYYYLIGKESVKNVIQQVVNFLQTRRDVLTPSPLHGLVRFLIKGDQKCNHGLQTSIDCLVSAFMIVSLLVSVLFGSILLIIQIRHESIHMIKLTSNLVNETIILQPSFQHMLPDKERMGDLMDTAVNNFYVVGRKWIGKQVNALGQDSPSNERLEEEVLQLWDRLYTYMMNTSLLLLPDDNRSQLVYPTDNPTFTLPTLFTQIQNNLGFGFSFNDLYRLIHDNLGLLRTVLDSVWSNATLLLTLLSSIISLLFTGGFALFNFLVSFIVFVTLLFYLLSHSDQSTYRPTEWLNSTLAIGGKGLGKAVNDAVTSVFVASLKIAAFYGVYTYVLHNMVGSNLVFLPAVIASVCAVTLKSYWAVLPGCLDVWLVQQRPLGALLLLLGQIIPVYVVDTAIYSEVKGGGHQYLTALAIAGGVYYRGIEGALIGPIVLCCLLVGVRLYNETMAETLSENQQQVPSLDRFRSRSFHRSRSLHTDTNRFDAT